MRPFFLRKVGQNVWPFSGHRHGPKRPKNRAIPGQSRKPATIGGQILTKKVGPCDRTKIVGRGVKTSNPGRLPHQTNLTNRNFGN